MRSGMRSARGRSGSETSISTSWKTPSSAISTYMTEDPRNIPSAAISSSHQEHRADRRPCDQHRRNRHLPGQRPVHAFGAPALRTVRSVGYAFDERFGKPKASHLRRPPDEDSSSGALSCHRRQSGSSANHRMVGYRNCDVHGRDPQCPVNVVTGLKLAPAPPLCERPAPRRSRRSRRTPRVACRRLVAPYDHVDVERVQLDPATDAASSLGGD